MFAFELPEDVRDSPHGIEGLHLGVERAAERWDYVTGVSVYHGYDRAMPTGPDSRFDMALGGMREALRPLATSSSSWR